jgi:hypothetical protein
VLISAAYFVHVESAHCLKGTKPCGMDRTESASIQVDSAKFVFDTRDESLLDPPQSTFCFRIYAGHTDSAPFHFL